MNLGYIRVSTKEQHVERQIEELKKYDIDDRFLFVDTISGTVKAERRPKYEAMKQVARRGDTIYIHELDRLGRNKQDILEELRYYKKEGIIIRILDIPTTMVTFQANDESSQLIMDMINNILIEVLATLAEQELKRLKKRQYEGMEQARAKGVKFGRKPLVVPDFEKIYDKWIQGEISAVEAYKTLNVSKTYFYARAKEIKERQGK